MRANRHGKKRLTFRSPRGRSHTREVLDCTILWETPDTGLLRVFHVIMVVSVNALNAPTSILEVNVLGEKSFFFLFSNMSHNTHCTNL